METSSEKIDRFRAFTEGRTPLIVGAGLTADNLADKMFRADGGIVGSWLKEGHVDASPLSRQNVRAFMRALTEVRGSEQEPHEGLAASGSG